MANIYNSKKKQDKKEWKKDIDNLGCNSPLYFFYFHIAPINIQKNLSKLLQFEYIKWLHFSCFLNNHMYDYLSI